MQQDLLEYILSTAAAHKTRLDAVFHLTEFLRLTGWILVKLTLRYRNLSCPIVVKTCRSSETHLTALHLSMAYVLPP